MSMKMKNEDGAWLPADAATYMDFEQSEPPQLVWVLYRGSRPTPASLREAKDAKEQRRREQRRGQLIRRLISAMVWCAFYSCALTASVLDPETET